MSAAVDRGSPIPYYLQVIALLEEQIRGGKLTPGDQLPGEHELCQEFNVSRTVIRQALNELTRKGLINREKGRGTFIAQPKIREKLFQKLTGFYQDMVDQGYRISTKVLAQQQVEAGLQVGAFLGIASDAPVIQVERLRFIDDEPMVYVTSYLPYARCPELLHADLSNQSLYAFLEHECGIFITRGTRSIEAISVSPREAELLGIRRGAPVIQLDSVSYEANDTPLEYYRALHRGDRSRFEVELLRVRSEGEPLTAFASARLPRSNIITPRKPDERTP